MLFERSTPVTAGPDSAERAEPHWPAAIVCSAFLTGLKVARALQRRGVDVTLVDCDPSVHGFRSAHVRTVLCPNPDVSPDEWLAFMRALASGMPRKPVLLSASDQFSSAIGTHTEDLREHYTLSPSAALQSELAVKEGQIRLAGEYGLPLPLSRLVTSARDLEDFASKARFPVLLKPRQHRFWSDAPPVHPLHAVKAVRLETIGDLRRTYGQAARLSPDVIVQELVAGPDTNKRVHIALYGRDGRRLSHMTLRKLRCLSLGMASVSEPVDDPVVAEHCDRFLRAIGYRGPCEIEMMWDDRDGVPKMLDINPRFTGAGHAIAFAGVDHSWITYLDLIGEPVVPVMPERTDFRYIGFEDDMTAIRQHWQSGQLSFAGLRRTYRRPFTFSDLDPSEWRLLFATLRRAMWTLAGTVLMAAGFHGRRRDDERVQERPRHTPTA